VGSIPKWTLLYKGSHFDIANVFTTWSANSFDVVLQADEFKKVCGYTVEGILRVKKSIFKIDYDNGSAPDPVPEPATMLLLGTGLAGFAVARLRKAKKGLM
jgi:hypothetical protein